MIYLVIGMHKSGTTLISKSLHESGINMVHSVEGASDCYFDQKYERLATLEINNDIIQGNWANTLKLGVPGPLKPNPAISSKAKHIISSVQKECSDWGFKDPRLCFTYNFWNRHLPQHKIIGVYRNPYDVIRHYGALSSPKRYKVLSLWQAYNARLVNIVKANPYNSIMLNYENYMSDDDGLGRLSDFCSLKICDVRVRKSNSKIYNAVFLEKILDELVVKVSAHTSIKKTVKELNRLSHN